MDAEVWSHADIRNGQRLFPILVILILAKESAVVGGLLLGLPWAALLAPPGRLVGQWGPGMQSASAFGLVAFLLLIASFGRVWALIGLGLTYVLTSGVALIGVLPEVMDRAAGEENLPAAGAALANCALGLVLGAMALWLPQLRAFVWSRASARLVIPLPDDDAPPRRNWRKQRTFGETLISFGQGLVNVVLVLIVLLIALFVYGFGGDLARLLTPP